MAVLMPLLKLIMFWLISYSDIVLFLKNCQKYYINGGNAQHFKQYLTSVDLELYEEW